jgi:hypothetical protein
MGHGQGQETTKETTERNEKEGEGSKHLVCSLVSLSALASNENSTFGPLRRSSVFRLIRPIITQNMTQS